MLLQLLLNNPPQPFKFYKVLSSPLPGGDESAMRIIFITTTSASPSFSLSERERERCCISKPNFITTTSSLSLYPAFTELLINISISKKRGLCLDGLLFGRRSGEGPCSAFSQLLIAICIFEKRGLCLASLPFGGRFRGGSSTAQTPPSHLHLHSIHCQ